MSFKDETVFTPSESVTWREVDDDLVVLKLETGEYYTFNNDLSRELWKGFAAGKTLAELVQEVVDNYNIDKPQAQNDIVNFASGLIQSGVLAE